MFSDSRRYRFNSFKFFPTLWLRLLLCCWILVLRVWQHSLIDIVAWIPCFRDILDLLDLYFSHLRKLRIYSSRFDISCESSESRSSDGSFGSIAFVFGPDVEIQS
jgi:hypothetical protein